MLGDERIQEGMFSYVSLEQRVPADHPLRAVRKLTDIVLSNDVRQALRDVENALARKAPTAGP